MLSTDQNLNTLGELFEEVVRYVRLRKDYSELWLVEKLTTVAAAAIVAVLVLLLTLTALFYASLGISFALMPSLGTLGSFMLTAAFFAFLAWVVYRFRESLVERPIVNFLASVLLGDDDEVVSKGDGVKEDNL